MIDAFRDDYVFKFDSNMPVLRKIIEDGNTCSFISQVQTPTVTLPRIKV